RARHVSESVLRRLLYGGLLRNHYSGDLRMLEMSVFFAIAGGILLGGYYLLQVAPRRRRANAMRRAAASLGFDYLGERDPFEGATGISRQRLNLLWAHQADTFRNVLRGTTAAGPTLVFDH